MDEEVFFTTMGIFSGTPQRKRESFIEFEKCEFFPSVEDMFSEQNQVTIKKFILYPEQVIGKMKNEK